MISKWLAVAAILGALSVMMGAFGAHVLKAEARNWPAERRQIRLDAWDTAATYQMYHALAMTSLALYLSRAPSRLGQAAACSLLLGILLFSGSLYALTVTDQKWLGAITPFGGVAFIAGWVLWAAAVLRAPLKAG